ncbi:16S rRNA (cytidine(1402)-2'-O)-methyltransferase [Chloroflexota bacterium]
MPSLYVVATPIGNLEDISPRAIRILREVGLIAAEDTRRTARLLNAYEVKTPLTSYHEHNKKAKLGFLMQRLKEFDMALVSDAGMPGISDPGHDLVVEAIGQNIRVIPIPGPSVVITAVAVSGLKSDSFRYLGFLPRKAGDRRRFLESVSGDVSTLVILEAPHRLLSALKDIITVLGDRRVAVCRELTKINEEIFRGTISQALSHFTTPRGEFALVVEGMTELATPQPADDVDSQLRELQLQGKTAKEAISEISGKTGISRRQLYQVWTRLIRGDGK